MSPTSYQYIPSVRRTSLAELVPFCLAQQLAKTFALFLPARSLDPDIFPFRYPCLLSLLLSLFPLSGLHQRTSLILSKPWCSVLHLERKKNLQQTRPPLPRSRTSPLERDHRPTLWSSRLIYALVSNPTSEPLALEPVRATRFLLNRPLFPFHLSFPLSSLPAPTHSLTHFPKSSSTT